MIFVTVGTDNHDFSRLVKAMDILARKNKIIMQIGNTSYQPRHAEWFRFEDNKRIDSLYENATTIVTHAGAGSIIRSLTSGKIPIVVPRLKKYNEHINDHQLDLACSLGDQGKIILVTNTEDLSNKLSLKKIPHKKETALLSKLSTYMEELS